MSFENTYGLLRAFDKHVGETSTKSSHKKCPKLNSKYADNYAMVILFETNKDEYMMMNNLWTLGVTSCPTSLQKLKSLRSAMIN